MSPVIDGPLLACRGVDVAYDGAQVLFGVDLEVAHGEVVVLLGTNGAGKSTLLKAISGLVPPTAGRIWFDGTDITHAGALTVSNMGIGHVPGGERCFPSLTVAEHFRVGTWRYARDDAAEVQAGVDDVLDLFPGLRERWAVRAGSLSGGEQAQLALALAFVARPRLLLVDELSQGLAPAVVEQLVGVVGEIQAQGAAVVLVEQSVHVARAVASRAYFLEKGEVRFSGPTASLLGRGDLLRSVFLPCAPAVPGGKGDGRRGPRARLAARAGASDEAPSAPVLEVHHLTKRFGGVTAVDGVTFTLHEGEILGLIGPNGAGKTTIFDVLSGLLPADSGRTRLRGVDVTAWRPDRRAAAGLGRSFQDARLFPTLTVAENVAVALDRHLEHRDHLAALLDLPAMRQQEEDVAFTVDDLVELMRLGAFRDTLVSELSTGVRRIVDLAMAIAHDPSVLLLDEPSSGIAQRETEALGPLLERIRRETGCALLVVEHDMPLVRSISDEILALDLGAVVVQGPPDVVLSDPRVVASYLGGDPDGIGLP